MATSHLVVLLSTVAPVLAASCLCYSLGQLAAYHLAQPLHTFNILLPEWAVTTTTTTTTTACYITTQSSPGVHRLVPRPAAHLARHLRRRGLPGLGQQGRAQDGGGAPENIYSNLENILIFYQNVVASLRSTERWHRAARIELDSGTRLGNNTSTA